MKPKIPYPKSAGYILSYRCTARCKHCMYACDSKWKGDWPSEKDLEDVLSVLAPYIEASPYGPHYVSLNYGLHFTGGEPFIKFDTLLKAVKIASKLKIPSIFVESNCFWSTDDEKTRKSLLELKANGLKGILISVNPFYLEYVPFERTERCVRIGYEIFGSNLMVYQQSYFNLFKKLGIKDTVKFDRYFDTIEKKEHMLQNTEFFFMGRAPYSLNSIVSGYFRKYRSEELVYLPCTPSFLRKWHNHIDNYFNYIPGYCGGLSLGDIRKLDDFADKIIDPDKYPIIYLIATNDFNGLLNLAKKYGYKEKKDGYYSKCHLCIDIRKHLVKNGDFLELKPKEFYDHLF